MKSDWIKIYHENITILIVDCSNLPLAFTWRAIDDISSKKSIGFRYVERLEKQNNRAPNVDEVYIQCKNARVATIYLHCSLSAKSRIRRLIDMRNNHPTNRILNLYQSTKKCWPLYILTERGNIAKKLHPTLNFMNWWFANKVYDD